MAGNGDGRPVEIVRQRRVAQHPGACLHQGLGRVERRDLWWHAWRGWQQQGVERAGHRLHGGAGRIALAVHGDIVRRQNVAATIQTRRHIGIIAVAPGGQLVAVDRKGLCRDDALRTVRRAQLFQNVEADIADRGTRRRQPRNRGLEACGNLRVQLVEQIAARDRQPQPGHREGCFGPAGTTCHDVVHDGAAIRAVAHRASSVKGCGKRVDAVGRHARRGRFQPDNAAKDGRGAG